MDDQGLYNQITVKNIDNEDFVFRVNHDHYVIRAGETRVYMKFMVRPLLKHLIDRILIKRDPEGKLLRNTAMRDELAAKIVLNEEVYEKPRVVTDRELVDQINTKPELDRILEKNKMRIREVEPQTLIPTPPVSLNIPVAEIEPELKDVTTPSLESFDQIEEENKQEPVKIPSREQMMSYAKNTLKLDVTEPKTKKVWDKMDDAKLYKELGLDREEDLSLLGFE